MVYLPVFGKALQVNQPLSAKNDELAICSVERVMSEKSNENHHEDLVLGVITPQRFLQGLAMVPALTIGVSVIAPFLAISFGVSGLAIFFFIILRALLDRRKLPNQIWAMAAVQLLAAGYVYYQYSAELAGTLFA